MADTRQLAVAGALGIAMVLTSGAAPAASAGGGTYRMSVSSDKVEANGPSGAAAVSGDCSLVAFASASSNLVPRDSRTHVDVLARDRDTRQTRLVSRARDGGRANGSSRPNSVSRTGRFVAYDSTASNLVTGDRNGWQDVFVRDLDRRRSELVSVTVGGGTGDGASTMPSISDNGRFVSFNSDAENLTVEPSMNDVDVFLRDRELGTTQLVSRGAGGALPDAGSGPSEISGNGRYVLFNSAATNLVEGGDGDTLIDAYRFDRLTGETILVSVGSGGAVTDDAPVSGDDISYDGRYVALTTYSHRMVDSPEVSEANVYWRDLLTGEVRMASVGTDGLPGDSFAFYASISGDGQVVSFDSQSNGLVPGDRNFKVDAFVRDVHRGVTRRATVSVAGRGVDRGGSASAGSSDGRCVAFTSDASKLVPRDRNGVADVFLRRLGPL